jgi:hypothetical protein
MDIYLSNTLTGKRKSLSNKEKEVSLPGPAFIGINI